MECSKKSKALCSLGGGTLRPKRELRVTEEEANTSPYTTLPVFGIDEVTGLNPQGNPGANGSGIRGGGGLQNPCARSQGPSLRIGAWNARTMMKKGKLENVKREMARMNINILALSEVCWREGGDYERWSEGDICRWG